MIAKFDLVKNSNVFFPTVNISTFFLFSSYFVKTYLNNLLLSPQHSHLSVPIIIKSSLSPISFGSLMANNCCDWFNTCTILRNSIINALYHSVWCLFFCNFTVATTSSALVICCIFDTDLIFPLICFVFTISSEITKKLPLQRILHVYYVHHKQKKILCKYFC